MMSNREILPVILSGGSGSRLWPLSRALYPKQFLQLTSDKSMLQDTVLRLQGAKFSNPLVICNEEHRFIAAEQMRETGALDKIILEPVGRNTAPAIALAALIAIKEGKDPLLLVLAADHYIIEKTGFNDRIHQACEYAEKGKLVTFGIVPTAAETGYGYIRRGTDVSSDESAFRVDQFVEKPGLETAEQYLECGEYYWNSGMFVFKASRYLEELKRYRSDILQGLQKSY